MDSPVYFLSLLLVFSGCLFVSHATREAEVEKIQESIFKSDYVSVIRPPGTEGNEYVTVRTNMYILDFSSIDDYEMQYTVQLYLRQKWVDERLKFKHISGNISFITVSDVAMIWTPDLFFVNEIDGNHHHTVKANQFARINSDGSVLYSVKLTLILSCPMSFEIYPFDYQKCPMRVESYGWSKKDLLLLFDHNQPVQVSNQLRLNEFELLRVFSNPSEVVLSTGKYSILEVGFLLKRKIKYFFLHLYLPTTMLVFTSWSSFWFHPSQVVARTIIGMSTLFSTTNLISAFNNGLPKVSYVRALDIWSGTCLGFIFLAFLEFLYVSYKHGSKQSAKETEDNTKSTDADDKSKNGESSVPKSPKALQKWIQKVSGGVNSVDSISRSVFPLVFSLFVILYFGIFMNIK